VLSYTSYGLNGLNGECRWYQTAVIWNAGSRFHMASHFGIGVFLTVWETYICAVITNTWTSYHKYCYYQPPSRLTGSLILDILCCYSLSFPEVQVAANILEYSIRMLLRYCPLPTLFGFGAAKIWLEQWVVRYTSRRFRDTWFWRKVGYVI